MTGTVQLVDSSQGPQHSQGSNSGYIGHARHQLHVSENTCADTI